MKILKSLKTLLLAATLSTGFYAHAQVPSVCDGTFLNPLAAVDLNNIFPITIFGITIGNTYPEPAVLNAVKGACVCPGIFGIPSPGIMATYWAPTTIYEIEHRPGCFSSLGGITILPGFSNLFSEQSQDADLKGQATNRMQVHNYRYPFLSDLKTLQNISCMQVPEPEVGGLSEIDLSHQDDVIATLLAPESILFSSPVAHAACAIDAAAASLGYPMDSLFFCQGTWGPTYPISGNSQHSGEPFTMNNSIQGKYLAKEHRLGLKWQSIGPAAMCQPIPNPIFVKSQYRVDQVGPVIRKGNPVVIGDPARLLQFPSITNPPGKENTTNLIFQAQQCCMRIIP